MYVAIKNIILLITDYYSYRHYNNTRSEQANIDDDYNLQNNVFIYCAIV